MGTAQKRLAKARKERHKRAHAFQMLKLEHLYIDEILMDHTRVLEGVAIWDLLRRCPKLGEDGARKVLEHSKVWPMTRVQALTLDERIRILQKLPQRVPRREE